jgi:hypothetical protein
LANEVNKTDTIDPATDGQDIEQQLNALLNDIDPPPPEAPPPPEVAAEGSPSATALPQAQQADDDSAASADNGDQLADQIQQMLDEDKARAEQQERADPPTEQQELATLDEQLAESVDDMDMVAGDFETIEDILGESQPEPAPEPIAPMPPEPRLPSKPQAVPAAQPSAATLHAARENDGDVAMENDAADHPVKPAPGLVMRSANIRRFAMRTCAAINKPLDAVAPDTRNLVGYVGLLTVFNGAGILIWKAMALMFAGE